MLILFFLINRLTSIKQHQVFKKTCKIICIHFSKKINLVQSTINTIRQRIIQMPQLIFLKRDLTGPMGLLRHFPTDLVNSGLNELTNYELIRQGRKHSSISISILYK